MGLTEVTGLVAALGATIAAIGAVVLLVYARRQAREMVEARYALSRPLVIPTGKPPLRGQGEVYGTQWFDLVAPPNQPIFRNIGPGPALNVWCVMFGPRPSEPEHEVAQRRTAWVDVPIPAGEEHLADCEQGRTTLDGNATLDGNPAHTLYAPTEPDQQDVMLRGVTHILARYTITYHDIFGQRHAAIFDFTFQHRWLCVGFFQIERDIEELNRERYAATMGAVTMPTQQQPRLAERVWERVRHPRKHG
jgi:hypothetical protein